MPMDDQDIHTDAPNDEREADARGLRRRTTWRLLGGVLFLVSCVVAWRCVVIADETEFALVTEFGRPVAIYGDQPNETGPHLRWPWQQKWSVDRRIHAFEPPPREMITGDKQDLDVSGFALWRVVDPLQFIQAAGSREAAEARLEERLSSSLGHAIGRRTLAQIVTTDEASWQLDDLVREVQREVEDSLRRDLGLEVVDLGLRRFVHPLEVRPAVFDLIRSERQKVAAGLKADGEARYRRIVSEADRDAAETMAVAEAEAERLKGEAEAERARILNQAHAADPELAKLLQTLDTYRSIFDRRATVVLSTSSPLFRLFQDGPEPTTLAPAVAEAPRTPGGTSEPAP